VTHQIVAIERNFERAGWYLMTRNLPQRARNAARNGHTSGADADEREVVGAFVALDDLVRNPGQGTADSIRIHYDRHAELLSEVERVM